MKGYILELIEFSQFKHMGIGMRDERQGKNRCGLSRGNTGFIE